MACSDSSECACESARLGRTCLSCEAGPWLRGGGCESTAQVSVVLPHLSLLAQLPLCFGFALRGLSRLPLSQAAAAPRLAARRHISPVVAPLSVAPRPEPRNRIIPQARRRSVRALLCSCASRCAPAGSFGFVHYHSCVCCRAIVFRFPETAQAGTCSSPQGGPRAAFAQARTAPGAVGALEAGTLPSVLSRGRLAPLPHSFSPQSLAPCARCAPARLRLVSSRWRGWGVRAHSTTEGGGCGWRSRLAEGATGRLAWSLPLSFGAVGAGVRAAHRHRRCCAVIRRRGGSLLLVQQEGHWSGQHAGAAMLLLHWEETCCPGCWGGSGPAAAASSAASSVVASDVSEAVRCGRAAAGGRAAALSSAPAGYSGGCFHPARKQASRKPSTWTIVS